MLDLSHIGLVQGGMLVGLSGVIWGAIQTVPARISQYFKYWFTITLSIPNQTEAFNMALELIQQKKPSFRSLRTYRKDGNGYGVSLGGKAEWFWYNKVLVSASRIVKDAPSMNNGEFILTSEDLYFTFYTKDHQITTQFLIELEQKAKAKSKEVPNVFTAYYDGWMSRGVLSQRVKESVYIEDGIKDAIFQDIDIFISSERKTFYANLGIPYKRGYLFHGPPGTGKTSLIRAIASFYNKHLQVVNLNKGMTDDKLQNSFGAVRPNSIVVFEDLDRMMAKTDEGDHVTMAGLLNALDGLLFKEGTIVIATSNDISKLDKALLRPGRFDQQFEINYATAPTIAAYVSKFFGQVIELKGTLLMPMAVVQEICLNSNTVEEAVAKIVN